MGKCEHDKGEKWELEFPYEFITKNLRAECPYCPSPKPSGGNGEICERCGDYLVCHYCLRKPLLEEISTLRAKLKLAEDVVEAAREYDCQDDDCYHPVCLTIRVYDEGGKV